MDITTSEATRQAIEIIAAFGLNVVAALAITLVGFAAAGWAARATDRALGRTERLDATLRHFFARLVRYAVIAFTVVAVLDQFGVETTSFVAVLGAAGIAIGLALQGTLSNIAAGVMLLLFRPFRVGEYIDAGGVAGTVELISLFTTELNTPDNVHIVVPNGQLWGTAIRNFSHNATRRLDITVRIDYEDDVGRAFEVLNGLVESEPRVAAEPAPQMMVVNLGESAVELQLRLWCQAADYWALRWDLLRRIKEGFDAAGITIPFPQRTVHHQQDGE